ncbi:uncharacterized protein [Choristoneura fumiferana]|uniref:uncharacterized protein n=1 Tax=Choristoneura fumiferana TaxID=7141 RepID=UPI003D15D6AA
MASTTLKLNTMKVEEENSLDSLLACRICLASDGKLFNIRERGLEQVFVDIMGATLSVCDGFPQHVCVWCRALLLRARELRARCQRAEHLLKDALIHQHYITTSFIRSIDRASHKLTHTYSQNCNNRDIYVMNHEDLQTYTQKSNPNWEVPIGNDTEMDIKDFDTNDDYDVKFDPSQDKEDDLIDPMPHDTPQASIVESSNNTVKDPMPHDTPQANIVESSNKTIKDPMPHDTPQPNIVESSNKTIKEERVLKRKKVVTNNTEKTNRKAKKKKGQTGDHPRLIPFSTKEHYKAFEEKYNFKIVALSEEEMVKEMEARKDAVTYKNSDFKCDMCFKGFFSSRTHEKHMKTHDPARRHACRLCGCRYFTPASLRRHTQSAHQLKFTCRQCGEDITGKLSAELHAAFHAGATFKCDHCDQQFLKKTSRSTHMRLRHPSEIADGGTCEQCGETFLSSMGLRRHKTWSHDILPNIPTLRCRTCKVRFESQDAIEKHRQEQPGGKCDDRHSSCPRCGEVCANEQDLLTHRMEQHGLEVFTCDMCGKSFESRSSVETHMDRVHFLIQPPKLRGRRHHPRLARDAAPVCEHCGKHYQSMAQLKTHLNTHTGIRPFKCTLCPKTYLTVQGLKAHEPFHTGARKWRCKECDATFMHQSSLYQHRRSQIHSGERAYQCHICSKTFTQSGSLQTHIKYVHMKMQPPPRKRNKKTAA